MPQSSVLICAVLNMCCFALFLCCSALQVIMGALIPYQLKKYFGPPTGPPDPRNVKIFKFLFFSVGLSKFGIILILGR